MPTKAKTRLPPGLTENALMRRSECVDYLSERSIAALMEFNRLPKNVLQYFGPEDILHVCICLLAKHAYKNLQLFHPKNEGKAGHIAQIKKKYMAVKPGFSDLEICRDDSVQTLYMEVKVKPNGPSPDQIKFIAMQRKRGHMAEVCFGLKQADEILNQYAR
jgi:hypothetical protein